MKGDGHIVVTGGAGFIGSHLVERLLRDGHSVVVIDDLSTGTLKNLSAIEGEARLKVLTSKVSQTKDLQGLLSDASAIYHLAAAVGVELVINSPIRTMHTNLHETEVILEAAAAYQVPILLASTSEVYGKSAKAVFTETDDLLIGPPTLGRWSYACSKLMDEFLGLAYFAERKLPVVIARLFNTVGPRQTGRYGMVLPRFVAAAKRNEPLPVYGDGQQTRCFCDVRDTVECLVRLMRVERWGEVFNVGSTEEVTIRALAERVIGQLGSQSPLRLIPYDEAYAPGFEDMLRRRPSIEKLQQAIGFRPQTSLDEIIARVAASLA